MRGSAALLALTGVVALVVAGCAQPDAALPPGLSGASSTPAEVRLAVTKVASAGTDFVVPLDAVPAASGSATYFTAESSAGRGVFAVGATGGAVTPLSVGPPWRSPTGIALAEDGGTLYIADPDADAVLALPVGGGTPAPVVGSAGLRPQGIEVAGGALYVTGVDPVTRTGAVLTLPVSGGRPRVLASGISMPEGVTVGPDGTVLVTKHPDVVLRISGGRTEPVVAGVALGSPAGLTLTPDGGSLLVSTLASGSGTAQLLIVDLRTREATVFTEVIGANPAAGGLHRAHGANVYAWADSRRTGGVYMLRP